MLKNNIIMFADILPILQTITIFSVIIFYNLTSKDK